MIRIILVDDHAVVRRGLAQLLDISQQPLEEYPEFDKQTADLFCHMINRWQQLGGWPL